MGSTTLISSAFTALLNCENYILEDSKSVIENPEISVEIPNHIGEELFDIPSSETDIFLYFFGIVNTSFSYAIIICYLLKLYVKINL